MTPPGYHLFVTTSYPRFAGDPAGCFVEARVRACTEAGIPVRVLAAGASTGPDPRMSGERLAVHRVAFAVPGAPPLFYGGGAPERLDSHAPAAWLQALRFWAGLLETLRACPPPAAIESHWLLPCALAVTRVWPTGPPHRAIAHSGDVALLERLPGGRALARRLLRAVAPVFVSGDLRARFAHLVGDGPDRAAALACPVEPARSALLDRPAPGTTIPAPLRATLRAELGLSGPVVLGVGRLQPIKGYDLLVRALGRLPRADRPTLVLLGDGPERGRLERLAAARAVDLRLPGEVPQPDVGRWLGAADVFVHPSRRLPGGRTEGQPLAVREALAAGLPVLAAATGGLHELGDRPSPGGASLELVPPDDPGALARALARRLGSIGDAPDPPCSFP